MGLSMSFKIDYTDRHGRARTHNYSGNVAGAKAWAESLARENGCKAVCRETPGLGDRPGTPERHIISVGDDGDGRR